MTGGSGWLLIPLQILAVDLLLGADNALVIAFACRALPPRDARRAAAIGVAGAIVARLAMTVAATWLLAVPWVKVAGALALMMMAINICDGDGFGVAPSAKPRGAARLWAAASVIIIADAAMGVDNVVALAAIARGNFWLLAIGVALSLPLLGYGGVLLGDVLRRAPGLVLFGAAVLGWLAGDVAISDPAIAPWATPNAPALVAIAPWLGAAFVYLYGRGDKPRAPLLARPIAATPAARPSPREPQAGAKPSRSAERRADQQYLNT